MISDIKRMKPVAQFHTDRIVEQWQELKSLLDSPSEEVGLDGNSLTTAQTVYVARYGGKAQIDVLGYDALLDSANALHRRLGLGEIIYGVNTGFGGSADTRTTEKEKLQRFLTRELSYGILPPGSRDHRREPLPESLTTAGYDLSLESPRDSLHLPWTWVRAAILIRMNSLMKGASAVRPVIVERMQDLLCHNIVPMIPLRGSISASGDLNPLAYIAGVVQGKSTIRILTKSHEDVYANDALAARGLEPITLQAKEGLAIVNGTAISAAAGALTIHDAHGLAVLAQMLTAMSVEGLLGSTESFHPFFGEARPHPGQIESAANILGFLNGSKLARGSDGTDGALRQDRYSIRTASQWIGPALEDLVLAQQQISIECNSTTDNPLFDSEGNVLHGGNFQARAVTSAMEKTRQAMQIIGRMLYTQCVEMINPATSRGLPPNLVGEDPSSSMILKGADIHVSALQSELGFLASPVNSVQTAELGNQALNSLALISTRYTATSVEVLSELAAAHLVTACQAVDLRAQHFDFLEMYRPLFFSFVQQLLHQHTSALTISDESFPETIWIHLIRLFDTTVHMDSNQRFPYMISALKLPFMDHESFKTLPDPLQALEGFCQGLQASLQETWCAHRDAYFVHGDASRYLGISSKQLYHFVRRVLNIPFLYTARILTPNPVEDSMVGQEIEAPTLGQYTSVVYRAIRDGTLSRVMLDIMINSHT